ncbi:polyprotein of EF-Ts, chloroplastic-like isoform X2 [Hibiscus syriacus]|uniref:polyprotein of EF-Ts, chloroplastic-like isoform X2 n=1 Tax=Hibiscus syriacus TaxID=106335 RepID=UPI001923EEC0|nr:polyprotein of EF-Ts, chloroplastic-like isoform X2 [Hibiscus syriacus]
MIPVIPFSVSNITFVPGAACTVRKNTSFTRCSSSRKNTRYALPSQRFILPLSTSFSPFRNYRTGHALHGKLGIRLSATGTDVAVEESGSSVTKVSDGGSETQPDAVETSEQSTSQPDSSSAPAQSKRTRPVRKSEMPPVKNEELIPGAMFTGKVRSIQPFGAFVDIGAFTEGLVHVSQLSDSFVKDVASVVSVGQEVKVRLVEVNNESGRISLSMRENDESGKRQPRKDGPATTDRERSPRKNTSRSSQKRDVKSSKFVKGQELDGTVKNLARSGAFISLPEGEEGFLPHEEESDDGLMSMMGNSSLQIGQEVKVRVLRITRGSVTLTMKKEEDDDKSDSQVTQGVVYTAANPFMLAFRQNKEIAAFLDQREKSEKLEVQPSAVDKETTTASTAADEMVEKETDTVADIANKDEETTEKEKGNSVEALSPESSLEVPLVDVVETDETAGSSEVVDQVTSENLIDADSTAKDVVQEEVPIAEDQTPAAASVEDEETGSIPDEQVETPLDEYKTPSATISDEKGSVASTDVQPDLADTKDADDTVENNASPDPSQESADDQIKSSGIEAVEEKENQSEDTKEDVQIETTFSPDPSQESTDNQIKSLGSEAVEEENPSEDMKEEAQIERPVSEGETTPTSEVEEADPASQKNDEVTDSNGTTPKENETKATISPALVKQLREETGAGMMDCKKALSETGGDIVKAQEFLRKKGLANADKKASRATAEGRIGSYIHDSRIGVLVEVNCETDFVSRGDTFKELVDDLAMQVAAFPQVQYLVPEEVPEEVVNKEKEIEMQKEDLLSKPELIRSKIVDGRIRKRLEELSLLEQPYIKNDKMVVKDWVKQTIATIGENIKVKRFVRFNLGEGLEKKSQDFAAEVAAQTAAKPVSTAGKEQSTPVEVKEADEKPKVAVAAALVKQLREETGAGMMDCKKALAETGGDIQKAQEYLRKKGLSTADKKSSRLAAEGRIGAYIHDSRIGVLIEVNCETDFVGRSEKFKELVDDLAMQVVACPQVQFVSIEDIPESIVSKEKELEMQRDDLASKPENIREKIVEGRVSKRLGELALLEQPFVKDDSLLVKDLVKQTVAALGENIKVRRFVRFTLGETTGDTITVTEA